MMYVDGLYVVQQGQSYKLYTPQGEPVALLFMGYDGQYMKDLMALRPITKAMGRRWGVKLENKSN